MAIEGPRDVLPPPERAFDGTVGTYFSDSVADVPALPSAPEGAPNVLLVLLDDVGFGHASTFGGPVNTPTLQRLAEEGLRYNRFHTTATSGKPDVAPVIFSVDGDDIVTAGFDVARTVRYKNVQANPRATVVIDDLASTDPWSPRGVKMIGTVTVEDGAGSQQFRIHPEVIIRESTTPHPVSLPWNDGPFGNPTGSLAFAGSQVPVQVTPRSRESAMADGQSFDFTRCRPRATTPACRCCTPW